MNFSVPQGSVAGQVLYLAYACMLEEVLQKQNAMKNQSTNGTLNWSQKYIGLYGFADDHAVKKEFTPTKVDDESQCLSSLEQCLVNIKAWMDSNRLKMNNSQTKFILFGSRSQLTKCTTEVIDVNGTEVPRSECICYLGEWFDQYMSLNSHITKKCATAILNFQKIKVIRYLTEDATTSLLLYLIISHLDYCYSILYGLPDCDISKFQRIQNLSPKLVLKCKKNDSATQCLNELHCLPIRERIIFKMLTLTNKCLHGEGPNYPKNLLALHPNTRQLRSSKMSYRLIVPFTTRQTFAARLFSVAAPRLWNNLPNSLKYSTSIEQLKKGL